MNKSEWAVVVGGVVLALLAVMVATKAGWLLQADSAASRWTVAHRSPGLTVLMLGATQLGTGVVYAFVVLAALPVWRQRGARYALIAMGSLALAQLVRVGLNLLVHRPRPPRAEWLVGVNFYSFPSGHTVAAGVGLGLVVWLLWLADRRMGVPAAVAAGGLVLLVGYSRVYLGVHWPSDVLGSIAFAVMWLGLTVMVVERLGWA